MVPIFKILCSTTECSEVECSGSDPEKTLFLTEWFILQHYIVLWSTTRKKKHFGLHQRCNRWKFLTASLFIFSKTGPSLEFSCWQAEGLFQLDKKKSPTCFLTISCDKTFGRCFSDAAGTVMHAQLDGYSSLVM